MLPASLQPSSSIPTALRPQFRPVLDEDSNNIPFGNFHDTIMQESEAFFQHRHEESIVDYSEILSREIELLRLRHLDDEFEGADDQTVPQFLQELRDNNIFPEPEEDAVLDVFSGVPTSHDYAPYSNKTECYLDMLDNLPRLRLSSSQLRMILWIMKECGAKDVPSFNGFHSMQAHIRKMTGDFANPEVAPHIQKYPEDGAGGPISEIWQVKEGRWHDTPIDMLLPLILVDSKRYYVHEVAELADGRWVIPTLWIKFCGTMHADCHLVGRDCDQGLITSIEGKTFRVLLDKFKQNQEQLLLRLGHHIIFPDVFREYAVNIPNRFHQIDNGDDLFTVWTPVWADNVSGEHSKQYQKHMNVYSANANLPGQLFQQEYNTGKPRNVEEIRECVLRQLQLATYGIAAPVEALQTATASPGRDPDLISNELMVWLSTQTDQPYNPLLDLPFFDPSQDTLVEILHTILLGDAKYTWYDLHHNWTPVQQDIFTIRLQSTNLDGLRVPPTTIFHIHDIVTPNQFTLVRALGELGPILWTAVIDDMEEYLADLQILIDNLLDAFANIDPSKILIKLKLHVLLHIVQDIRRCGPSVRFSTEIFECFNAIFRLCLVLSNHQAPSRDIAFKFADLDRVKHILSGGFWLQDGVWVRAGKDVNRILCNTPIIQRHLGWAPPPTYIPGLVQPVAQKKQNNLPALSRAETLLEGAANPFSIAIDPTTLWTPALNVVLPRLEKSSHDLTSRLKMVFDSTRLDLAELSHSKSTQVDSSR
ncbi:hypothetical protein B0H10DRAFT_2215060 [Mycena sp. CBHHK59/15]|nr:hypothetical protein B0H10DRAFT_2215060 [Mycena sp. CBHHK59/15]